jgi:mannose-6-phosphate isomerase-like protein (cupin superfamily)
MGSPGYDNFKGTQHHGLAIMRAINLAEKLATFSEFWQPRVVGQFNGNDLMVVKVKGEFIWHKHEETDDFFLVLSGRIRIQLRGAEVSLGAGEVFVVPKGMEHRPVADEEAHVLLIEPQGTPNTGSAATAAARREI